MNRCGATMNQKRGAGVTEETRVIDPDTGGEKGIKLQRYDLVPMNALRELAEHYGKNCLDHGGKYEPNNWLRGYAWHLSFRSAIGHLQEFWAGEDIDPENGSKHVIAAAWHCFALATFMDLFPEKDDRAKRVPSGRLTVFGPFATEKAAHLNGAIIECLDPDDPDDEWEVVDEPHWNDGLQYRVQSTFGAKPPTDLPQKPSTYVCGPMRGVPQFGFPAFDKARDMLQEQGYDVVSPADMDRDVGFDATLLRDDTDWNEVPDDFDLEDCVNRDLEAVKSCDELYRLEGWANSKGARAEVAVAEWLGKKVWGANE